MQLELGRYSPVLLRLWTGWLSRLLAVVVPYKEHS